MQIFRDQRINIEGNSQNPQIAYRPPNISKMIKSVCLGGQAGIEDIVDACRFLTG